MMHGDACLGFLKMIDMTIMIPLMTIFRNKEKQRTQSKLLSRDFHACWGVVRPAMHGQQTVNGIDIWKTVSKLMTTDHDLT